jgi:hypothetical protein
VACTEESLGARLERKWWGACCGLGLCGEPWRRSMPRGIRRCWMRSGRGRALSGFFPITTTSPARRRRRGPVSLSREFVDTAVSWDIPKAPQLPGFCWRKGGIWQLTGRLAQLGEHQNHPNGANRIGPCLHGASWAGGSSTPVSSPRRPLCARHGSNVRTPPLHCRSSCRSHHGSMAMRLGLRDHRRKEP